MMRSEDQVIAAALQILAKRLTKTDTFANSPKVIKDYLTVKLAQEEREIFGVVWLDARNGIIKVEDLFFGTLTQAAVYPREVVKAALACNAAAAIFFHNHPSGNAEPSKADEKLTGVLQQALNLVDVRVLDHIIVGGIETMSFADRGLI